MPLLTFIGDIDLDKSIENERLKGEREHIRKTTCSQTIS